MGIVRKCFSHARARGEMLCSDRGRELSWLRAGARAGRISGGSEADSGQGAQRREKVSYVREIALLLEKKCTGCHSSVLAEKGLSLESVAEMRKGGKRGQAIVPGKAESSLMFKMAAHRVQPVMPPADKPANKPMTSLELGLLQMWIDQGARDDSEEEEPKSEVPASLELATASTGPPADQCGGYDS